MYLSKLEIHGFKSFATISSLEFQRGITAIVGPNGSGKSNVADSIRWVLGEQSLKLLRGKKSDDVIFAGSDKKGRLGVAEVSLHLNNEDSSAPVDYSEIVITRRVYRNGEGEYLINHQPARLQDIQLLLAQANFGQRTYSVIGQGMIDSFLISSPQERKHLFDEAAGVRQYQLKKDQAVQKLTLSKENLAQGEAIMVEIEPRLRSLTRQVKRLEKREEIERSLREKQTLFFGLRWQEVQQELQTLHGQHGEATKQQAAITHELNTIQAELESIEKERSASDAFAGLQKTYNTILDEKNRLLEQQASIKGKLEVAVTQAGGGETAFLQKRGQELQRIIRQLHEEQEVLASSADAQRDQLKKSETHLAEVESTFTQLERRVQDLQETMRNQMSLPEAHQALDVWFQKYDAFVQELMDAESLDSTSIREQATTLHREVESLVKKLGGSHRDAHPHALSELQDQLLEQAKARQEVFQGVIHLRSQLQVADQQAEQLTIRRQQAESEAETISRDISVQDLAKTNPDEAYATYVHEAKKIDAAVVAVDERLKSAREEINNFNQLETAKKERLFALQKEFRNTQHQLNIATSRTNELQVQLARLEQRHEDLKREIHEAMGELGNTDVESAAASTLHGDVVMLGEEIGSLRHQLQLIGGIDETVTQEYSETNERWEYLNKQAEDLKSGITSLDAAIAELDKIIATRFDAAFKKINEEFNTYFRTLFRGGRAELVLIKEVINPDEPDVTEAEAAMAETQEPAAEKPAPKGEKVVTGIDIKATPPGKKLQSIAMLSGGERALTSIALLCAIISNNPSPFVVLDEVDAALDEANSQRFSAILDQLAHKTQFVTITHNRATMEKASIMYGVTMGADGVSQLLSVKMEQAEEIIRQHGNR